jgi:hypothetical protein
MTGGLLGKSLGNSSINWGFEWDIPQAKWRFRAGKIMEL